MPARTRHDSGSPSLELLRETCDVERTAPAEIAQENVGFALPFQCWGQRRTKRYVLEILVSVLSALPTRSHLRAHRASYGKLLTR